MNALPVIVVGAGGHAGVVADALLGAGEHVIGFVDSDPRRIGQRLLGLPVLGSDDCLINFDRVAHRLANGIGGVGDTANVPTRRAQVQRRLEAEGWQFCNVRHPSAVVSAHARLGVSAQLLAACVVQPGACIGHGAIVNTRAVVEHDAIVGDYAHIAPGALLCGGVIVGETAHIGAGAVVRQNVTVGPGVVVGVGAAVVRDVVSGVVIGVPAHALEQAK